MLASPSCGQLALHWAESVRSIRQWVDRLGTTEHVNAFLMAFVIFWALVVLFSILQSCVEVAIQVESPDAKSAQDERPQGDLSGSAAVDVGSPDASETREERNISGDHHEKKTEAR